MVIIRLLECWRVLSTACLRLSLPIRVRHAEQSIIELYDEHTLWFTTHSFFLERLAQLAGGTTAAQALLPVLENNYAMAQVVAEQDIRLKTGTIEIPTSQNQRTVAF